MKKRNKKILSACSLASLVISSSVVSTGVKAASSQPSSTRISGSDRYETAVQVSKTGWTSSDYVVIANGQGYADALCANPLAKAKNAPVLLTQSDSLSSSTIAEIKRLNAKHVIIVGGTGVVKSNIEDTIKSQTSADITRYAGADRYETSAKIAAAIGSTSKIVLASGQGFADALSAAPAASIEGIPILLTQANTIPQKTADYIKANSGITKTYVIGGTASVSDSVLSQVPSGQRFGGADRFATNAAVINGLSSDFNFSNLYVALGVGPTGNEFADALTGTALAAKNKSALVITSNPLSSYTTQLLKDKLTTGSTITVLGGTANISDSIVSQLKDAVTKSGSTSGGGGSDSTSGSNVTATLLKSNSTYTSIVDRLNSGDLVNNYFTVRANDTSAAVNVDLKKTDTTVSSIFTDAQQKYTTNGVLDEAKVRDDVSKVNDKLNKLYNDSNSLAKLTVNDKDMQTILKGIGSKYIDSTTGTLNADAIVAEAKTKVGKYDGDTGFNDFKADLNIKLKAYLDNNESKDTKTEIKLAGYKISTVRKNGTIFYSTAYDTQTIANNLVDLVASTTQINDSYALYLASGDYVLINVNAPTTTN